jgi:hypothetical protein
MRSAAPATVFAKKKQQDAVFFVKTAPRASADPGSPKRASQDAKCSTSKLCLPRKTAGCCVFREDSSSSFRRSRLAEACFAGCEVQHQQAVFAKKKQQDAVFFVKTAPRASADPGYPDNCFAKCVRGCPYRGAGVADKRRQDAGA